MRREPFDALADYRTSPLFSERGRAALALVEETTGARRVSDAAWAALRAHFNLQATALGFESEGLAARV